MHIMNTAALLCTALTLSAHPQAHGQEQGRLSGKQVRFLFLSKHKATPDNVHLMGRSGPELTSISTRSPGRYHAIPASGKILLGNVEMREGKEVVVPFASGKMPENATKALALVMPASASDYRMIVLDERNFRPGSICFLNTTGNNVGALIDQKRYGIKAKSSNVVHPKVGNQARNTYAAFYDIGTPAKPRRSKIITERTWNISPDRAEVCVFFADPSRKAIGIRVLSSYYHKIPKNPASGE